VGQAAVTQRQHHRGQPGDRAAECLADTHAHSVPEADAAPPHTEPVGDGVPAPDRFAAPDRDATADRRADVRVPDGHPGTHPVGKHVREHVGEHVGNRLTGRPVSRLVSAAGRPPHTAWAA
jgi:hypothetical protein